MSRAFEELFAIPDAFRGMPMAGRTDAWILSDAATAHGVPADSSDARAFPRPLSRHLARELAQPGSAQRADAGRSRAARRASPRDDAYLALLTGNYEAGAQLKLEYFDLWRYFPCGAFGDDAPDRNGLLPRALARVGGVRRTARSQPPTRSSSATRRSISRARRPAARDRSPSRPAVTTWTTLRAAGRRRGVRGSDATLPQSIAAIGS